MLKLPPLSCNSHCHVFGDKARFPYEGNLAEFPKASLYALNDRLGLERCVIVQSKVHGYDNAATEEAVVTRLKTYRGIALLPTDVETKELNRLENNGFRGVRFNYMAHLGEGEPYENVLALAKRLKPLDWHLQIHGSPQSVLFEVVPTLLKAEIPIVIDHIGRIDASEGLKCKHFQQILRLMDNPLVYMKVSGIDRISKQGKPYDDALPFAKKLVSDYPDKSVWGNDAPHPNHTEKFIDEEVLVQKIHEIAPTKTLLHKMMVDNPAKLYRF